MSRVNLFWFRRDLRLEDNHGLYQALRSGLPVLPLFIFDTYILDKLEARSDPRITFIHQELSRLNEELGQHGGSILVLHGRPEEIFSDIIGKYDIAAVYCNHDYEPYARERDESIRKALSSAGIPFNSFKDQVIFEKDDIAKDDGKPYTVFTPYSRKWKGGFREQGIRPFPSENFKELFFKTLPFGMPSLDGMGFQKSDCTFPERRIESGLLENYHLTRDYPSLNGTSRLGLHLRFGTISIRALVEQASRTNEVFLNELIWREFYMMILWHFPHVASGAFKPSYDRISWRNDDAGFRAWCDGMTGFPIVDAGIRQMNRTGFMHNRVRMITASFLTKHLLIDWRWGEAYFAAKLLDFELASNNGGWQWAAGTGCDAAPYFRVFNPALQAQKFDPDGKYIREWVPGLMDDDYPKPIVDHSEARNRAIIAYQRAIRD
jgi:deoxyribodipyrimidine photo-lyase